MHINRDTAKQLIPLLKEFVNSGYLCSDLEKRKRIKKYKKVEVIE